MVAYNDVTQKAIVVSLQTDLSNSSSILKLYQATYGSYPTTLDGSKCPTAPNADTNYCLRPSANNSYNNYTSNGTTFTLEETNSNGTKYFITDSLSPQAGGFNLALADPANWMTIGTQVWAKANLNVGVMIGDTSNQTNDSTTQKYCYNNSESNCTTYGGLYQWDEAM